jgi:lysophospholipase L1-like esterase
MGPVTAAGRPGASFLRQSLARPGRPRPSRWTHTWTAAPQPSAPGDLPPEPFTAGGVVFADTTLRQTVRLTAGGRRLRVRFANVFGGAALPITAASVALPLGGRAGVAELVPGSCRPLTFGGSPSVIVPAGAQVVSDPVPFVFEAGANLSVSAYLATGQASTAVTSHPGSRTTSYLVTADLHDAPELPGAVPVDHWYLISGVETESTEVALAVIGDSLSDGRGSTTNGNDRWPDLLFARSGRSAVLNQAAGGNRMLSDHLAPSVLARLDRDVLATSGVDRLLLFAGINDIGTTPAADEYQRRVVTDLLTAYRQVVLRSHAAGIAVAGATLTPFGGNEDYDDPAGLRERSRQAVNDRIRHGRIFDGVADFDAATRHPADPRRLTPAYDTGDHLHLNPTGYAVLALAVPIGLVT